MLNDYEYVFVLTYGRSGSTLLMKLLNTLPGYNIRGENWNALFNLFKAIDSLARTRNRATGGENDTSDPWYGAALVDADQFRSDCLESFVRNALAPQPGDRVLGFKEVRHHFPHMTKDLFKEYVAFILENFPGARIIFNTRDPKAVAASGWYRQMPRKVARGRIAPSREWYHETAATEPRCFVIDYTDLVSKSTRLRELFDWLGADYDEGAVQGVLDVKLEHAMDFKKLPRKSLLSKAKALFN